jgi:hypothetical protein
MADTAGPVAEPRLEARVARLEADVAHMRGDIAEIKVTLNRLAPLIDEFRAFLAATLPTLATKAELADLRPVLKSDIADLRAELKSDIAALHAELAHLRAEVLQRPTRRQAILDMFAIVGQVGAVLAIATHFAH